MDDIRRELFVSRMPVTLASSLRDAPDTLTLSQLVERAKVHGE